jgi:hypothetical protein
LIFIDLSKFEGEFYSKKKNLITDLDEKYHRDVLKSPRSSGKYFYTYAQADLALSLRVTPI